MTEVRTGIGDLLNQDGRPVSDDSAKAGILNDYFSSVFTTEEGEVPEFTWQRALPGISHVSITNEAAQHKLTSLKTISSPGPDDIHPRMLGKSLLEV